MSKKVKQPSLKSIEKDCNTIELDKRNRILIVSSPYPSALLASAILSRTMMRLDRRFHITFIEPVVRIDDINELKQKYDSSALILVGLDLLGATRIKKGSGYPIIIGGKSESEQTESLRLGTDFTLTAAAFALSKSVTEQTDYDLQLAVAGALLNIDIDKPTKDANTDIFGLAKSKSLVEERKGFRLLGVSMLPLDEVFFYSTNPYLKGISGNQKVCDSLLNEAEIPVPKLRTPLNNLSSKEAQQLTSKLILNIDPNTLPHLLGTDFEFIKERESSPIRHLSGIEIMGLTAWTLGELGAFMSILLGDRGRSLRLVIDSHMNHHKDVISTVQRLESSTRSESTLDATSLKINGVKNELLPDIGRIVLESGIVDKGSPVALENEDSFIVIWPARNLSLKEVYQKILNNNVELTATSSQSIRIIGSNQEKERGLQIISEMNKKSG